MEQGLASGHLPILSLSTEVKSLEAQGADSNQGPESGGPGSADSGEQRPQMGTPRDPGLSCTHKEGLKAGIRAAVPLCI